MASTPISLPILAPPPAKATSPPPSLPSNSSATPPPSDSTPPLQTPPSAPPSSSPPPADPPPSSPPPPPSETPPPASPPPASPPPPPPNAPPPAENPPPPPPLVRSSPPPSVSAPPPERAPSPPPPPATPPEKAASPPPPAATPPEKAASPPPPAATPPSAPPPETSTNFPPPSPSVVASPPPPFTSPISSPPTKTNSSTPAAPVPLPSVPTEKPIAKDTHSTNDTASTSPTSDGLKAGGAVAVGVVIAVVVVSLVMAVWFVQRRKKKGSDSKTGFNNYHMPSPFASSQNSDSAFLRSHSPPTLAATGSNGSFMYSPPDQVGGLNNSRSWFTYEELDHATDGFSSLNILGEGGFGCVYKGILPDGRDIAVKQLKIGSGQGEREFRAEVEIISRVHHRHLVSLVGYCIADHNRLLVYDYVQNDTLHYHLHCENRPVMDWAMRVRVAAGAARGISYLHEDCHPRIIHRDIKSSNILLDKNFEAQVADFGLAKLNLGTDTHVSTRVMGTFGYMAPEYATSGKLTEKSDVYSYGVVLLELITGRKPVDSSQPLGDESLVEWARPLLNRALEEEEFEGVVDPRLEKNYVETEMFRMMEAAAACIRHSATRRPRMSQVVRAFDSLDDLEDLSNGMRPGQSEIFNSREQSAEIRMFRRMAFGSQEHSSEFFNRTQSSWRSRGSNMDQSM